MCRLCLVALVALSACKDKDKDKGPAATAPAATEPADRPPVAPADAAAPAKPAMLNKMKNCPSAIAGAHTTIERADGAIVAIVIGKDKPAIDTIRERARRVATIAGKTVTDPKHTGEGTGGAVGKCPSHAPGATAEVADIDGGAKLTFRPNKPEDAGAIAEMLKVRAKALNARGGRPVGSGGGRGAGGGHGGHGSTGRGGP